MPEYSKASALLNVLGPGGGRPGGPRVGTAPKAGPSQMVTDPEGAEEMMAAGWRFVALLPNGRVVEGGGAAPSGADSGAAARVRPVPVGRGAATGDASGMLKVVAPDRGGSPEMTGERPRRANKDPVINVASWLHQTVPCCELPDSYQTGNGTPRSCYQIVALCSSVMRVAPSRPIRGVSSSRLY